MVREIVSLCFKNFLKRKVVTQKRKLFDELMEGVESMEQQRTAKVTLRTHEIDDLPPLKLDTVKLPHGIRDERGRL